jgi:hypothetical protein
MHALLSCQLNGAAPLLTRPARRPAVNWRLQMVGLCEDEPVTDMHMPLVASDLGYHLRQAAKLGVPLYVTETGVADRSDQFRGRMVREYYGQVSGRC